MLQKGRDQAYDTFPTQSKNKVIIFQGDTCIVILEGKKIDKHISASRLSLFVQKHFWMSTHTYIISKECYYSDEK